MAESYDFMCGWLRGFFDGEGSISFKVFVKGKKHTSYYLTVGNTDIVLMNKCKHYLDRLGIGHTKFEYRKRENRKRFYILHICKAIDVLKFYDLIGFNSPEKQARLETTINWITRDKKYYRIGEVVELRRNGCSFRDIVKKMNLKEGSHSRLSKLYELENEKWQTKNNG